MIPMLDLRREYEWMKADIDAAIEECLKHQRWINGAEVTTLERVVADYIGVKHCVGVASGTDALVLALEAWGLDGENIATTPFTFVATADAILRVGGIPVFVDIEPDTFNMKLDEIPVDVQGVIPVHLYGCPCDMDKLACLGMAVIEDCAQSFGALYNGKKTGSLGDAAAFSFFPSKNLGCFGDGGIVATNNADVAEQVRILARHGGKDKYDCERLGYNSRLDTMQAAILLAKMKYIDTLNWMRMQRAGWYRELLAGIDWLTLPAPNEGHVYHQFTVRVKNGKRDELAKYLKANGVDTMVYYPVPLHKMKLFRDRCYIHGSLENAERAAAEVLSLPIEPLMSRQEVEQVAEAVRKFTWQ